MRYFVIRNFVNRKLELVTAGLILAASIVLVCSGWFSYQTSQDYMQAQRRIIAITQQLRVLNLTLSTFENAETGQRGFLLTNKRAYLEPYLAAVRVVDTNVAWLSELWSAEPEFKGYLSEIHRLKDEKFAELAQTIRLNVESRREAALQLVSTDAGKKTMDRLRNVFGTMAHAKRIELASIEREAEQRAEWAELATLAFGGLIALFMSAIYIMVIRELHERRRLNQTAHLDQNRDRVTGLHNYGFFRTLVSNGLKQAYRDNTRLALLVLDWDAGSGAGRGKADALRVAIAELLDSAVNHGHAISPLRNGQFAIMVSPARSDQDIAAFTQDLLDQLTLRLLSQTPGGHFTARVGIATFPEDAQTVSRLLHCAKQALVRTSVDDKMRYGFCSDSHGVQPSRRELLTHGLQRAVETQQFILRFQPQVVLSTREIIGAEALIRWEHPELGPIGPDEFIPIAEQTGFILPIGTWVLREACRQAGIWNAHGRPLRVAVNIASLQLADPNFGNTIAAALRDANLPAHQLEIELTERVMMARETNALLTTIRASGVHIAIDDFGTGYSSLNYLSRFPANVLKIDKSFIDNVPFHDRDAGVVRTILNIGRELGMTVVAEGIESPDQAEFLARHHCDVGQGYFYYRPIGADEFAKLVLNQPAPPVPASGPRLGAV